MVFREIEHASETGFIAQADTLEELFSEAAKALFEVMTDTAKIRHSIERDVSLDASDAQQLLHEWLEELNFLSQTEREFYNCFEVAIADNRLSAAVRGESIEQGRHEMRAEVKAVTYGDFYLKKTGDKWEARVILDV